MYQHPLKDRIVEAFDTMPAQLQSAARYVLDTPQDVALLSMREQARRAAVQPATMTRFAKHLGLEGYDEVRALYAEAMRNANLGFAVKAHSQVAAQRLRGGKALSAEMLSSIGAQIAALTNAEALARFDAAARRLAEAGRIFCLGLRSSHAVAWHLHYILSLCGASSIYLDGGGGTGPDALAQASSKDVLVAVSVLPYTRTTFELAQYASGRGLSVLAITDSEVSPLAQIAAQSILISTESPSFLHAMSPAFVAAEIVGALVAGRRGESALAALRQTDTHLANLNVHLKPRSGKSRT